MYYTLENFMKDGISPDIRRLTKEADFSGVRIRAVSVHELPLEDFVGENELVLSTTVGCDTEPALFHELIVGVKAARAAALILSFKDPDYRRRTRWPVPTRWSCLSS